MGRERVVWEGHKRDGCWYCSVDKCVCVCVFVEVLLLSPNGVFLTCFPAREDVILCWLISSSLFSLCFFSPYRSSAHQR